jgi:hypothetical protein
VIVPRPRDRGLGQIFTTLPLHLQRQRPKHKGMLRVTGWGGRALGPAAALSKQVPHSQDLPSLLPPSLPPVVDTPKRGDSHLTTSFSTPAGTMHCAEKHGVCCQTGMLRAIPPLAHQAGSVCLVPSWAADQPAACQPQLRSEQARLEQALKQAQHSAPEAQSTFAVLVRLASLLQLCLPAAPSPAKLWLCAVRRTFTLACQARHSKGRAKAILCGTTLELQQHPPPAAPAKVCNHR